MCAGTPGLLRRTALKGHFPAVIPCAYNVRFTLQLMFWEERTWNISVKQVPSWPTFLSTNDQVGSRVLGVSSRSRLN